MIPPTSPNSDNCLIVAVYSAGVSDTILLVDTIFSLMSLQEIGGGIRGFMGRVLNTAYVSAIVSSSASGFLAHGSGLIASQKNAAHSGIGYGMMGGREHRRGEMGGLGEGDILEVGRRNSEGGSGKVTECGTLGSWEDEKLR